MMTAFEEMDPSSRVWIYQANKELTKSEIDAVNSDAAGFISNWSAHGQALKASFKIFYNRFLVIMVDEGQAMASGCSIDKCVQFIQQLETKYNISLLDRMQIAYKENETIKVCDLHDFRMKIEAGEIKDDTIVFNNVVANKEEFEKGWQIPFKDSWHKQLA